MAEKNIFKDILYGVAIGDALGVPVEFNSREAIAEDPVTDMRGYGTHNQPPGYFSDDSSLMFCLAEALTKGYDLQMIADNFVTWLNDGYWTPEGYVFDVGIATRKAIRLLETGVDPVAAGGRNEDDNGNGSLMRMLPLVVYTMAMPVKQRFETVKQVSSITHGHIRSVIACFYYLEFAAKLIQGADKFLAYKQLQSEMPVFFEQENIDPQEVALYSRLLKEEIKG